MLIINAVEEIGEKPLGVASTPPCTPQGYQGAKKQAHNLNSYYVIFDFVNVLITSRYSLMLVLVAIKMEKLSGIT